MPEPHERLNEAMNQRRLALRMNWRGVAQAAGISYEALRAIRRGDYRPTELTARGLDDALEWMPGSLFAILDGGDPVPAEAAATEGPTPETPATMTSRELEILQDLIESTAGRLGLSPEEADEAYRRARMKIGERRAAEERPDDPPARRRGRAS